MDLYGPMPSSRHVVVVHDLASRYPAAKLGSSTKAEEVLPVLADIYDTHSAIRRYKYLTTGHHLIV